MDDDTEMQKVVQSSLIRFVSFQRFLKVLLLFIYQQTEMAESVALKVLRGDV
jgi:hypothetical protein